LRLGYKLTQYSVSRFLQQLFEAIYLIQTGDLGSCHFAVLAWYADILFIAGQAESTQPFVADTYSEIISRIFARD